jgi:hypothetical protein
MPPKLVEEEDLEDLPPLEDLPDSDQSVPKRDAKAGAKPSTSSSGSRGPKRKAKPGPRKPPGPPSRDWWLRTFNEMAAKGAYSGGIACAGVLPTTATVLQVRSPVIGDAVEEAAKRDARVYAVCKMVYDSQIWVMIATTIGALLVAVAIDLGRFPAYVAEIDETHVVPNPLVHFVLPEEALGIAINRDREYRRQRTVAAQVKASKAAAGPVEPPKWYGNGSAGAEGVMGGTPAVASE